MTIHTHTTVLRVRRHRDRRPSSTSNECTERNGVWERGKGKRSETGFSKEMNATQKISGKLMAIEAGLYSNVGNLSCPAWNCRAGAYAHTPPPRQHAKAFSSITAKNEEMLTKNRYSPSKNVKSRM